MAPIVKKKKIIIINIFGRHVMSLLSVFFFIEKIPILFYGLSQENGGYVHATGNEVPYPNCWRYRPTMKQIGLRYMLDIIRYDVIYLRSLPSKFNII